MCSYVCMKSSTTNDIPGLSLDSDHDAWSNLAVKDEFHRGSFGQRFACSGDTH
jgi:hypothetical protein